MRTTWRAAGISGKNRRTRLNLTERTKARKQGEKRAEKDETQADLLYYVYRSGKHYDPKDFAK
jgi:hypothetical protein